MDVASEFCYSTIVFIRQNFTTLMDGFVFLLREIISVFINHYIQRLRNVFYCIFDTVMTIPNLSIKYYFLPTQLWRTTAKTMPN